MKFWLALAFASCCLAQVPGTDSRPLKVLHGDVSAPPPGVSGGDVVVEVTLDSSGNVIAAQAVAGPMELLQAALRDVVEIHFSPEVRAGQVKVTALPPGARERAFLAPPVTSPFEFDPGDLEILSSGAPVFPPVVPGQEPTSGEVAVDVLLDSHGVLTSARAISGPESLRNLALRYVVAVEFGSRKQSGRVMVRFKPGPAARPSIQVPSALELPIAYVDVEGILAESHRERILDSLRPLTGRIFDSEVAREIQTRTAVLDPHLRLTARPEPPGGLRLVLSPRPRAASSSQVQGAVKVDSGNQASKLIQHPRPVYPPLAKQARIQGVVRVLVTIGPDGRVDDAKLISGHPLLAEAALSAVRQYIYRPTLVDGVAVPVVTTVDVDYSIR